MPNPFYAAADAWISRRARPQPDTLAAVADRSPAVIVTGGSRGLGLALARRFAHAGHVIVLVAREATTLEQAGARLAQETGRRVEILSLDVTRTDAAASLSRALETHRLYLDVLINSAGIGLAGPFDAAAPDRMAALIDLNVTALTRLTHAFLPAMLARGRGGIINVASLGAYVPGPHQALYYASKAFVLSLTEAVAWECPGRGVRIMALAPGPLETGFHAAMGAEASLYRRLLPGGSADRAARSAYISYRLARSVATPGVLSTAVRWSLRLLPHPLTVPLVKGLLYVPGSVRQGKGRSRLET